MTTRGFLRVFALCTVALWALLITVWLTAQTIVAVEKGRRSWRNLTWRDTEATDTSLTTGDTAMTDTMATDTMTTDTMVTRTPTLEEDLATIRAAEEMATTTYPGSARDKLAKIRAANEARKRIAASQAK